MSKQYRQGDVLLERVDAIPAGLKPVERENGKVVLAHGEVTGHSHAISDRLARLFGEDTGDRFLELVATCALQHQEHGTITLEPGIYRVRRQRQYTPAGIERVAD